MGFPRPGKLRALYLLALAQMAIGPLVLLYVTTFCQMTHRGATGSEVARASESTAAPRGYGNEANPAIVEIPPAGKNNGKETPGKDGPDGKLEKAKQALQAWAGNRALFDEAAAHLKIADRARMWTPAWPQAPPGPPPRMG